MDYLQGYFFLDTEQPENYIAITLNDLSLHLMYGDVWKRMNYSTIREKCGMERKREMWDKKMSRV